MMGSEFNPFLSQRRTVVWESGRRKSYMNICEHRVLTSELHRTNEKMSSWVLGMLYRWEPVSQRGTEN